VLGAAVCLGVALGSATPAFACGETQQAMPRQAPTDPPPLALGDSVLADTVPQLAAAGYEANGMVCRTVDQGLAILQARGNRLPSLVVFALGTNGGISDAQVKEALAILGPSRRLVLVTPHHGDDPNSPQVVRAEVSRYAPQTLLLDWDQLSSSHPEWFAADGVHLGNDAGIHAYASMIISALPYATAGQVQAIPTPPPPPPTPGAGARPVRHHPAAINVFRRAARAMARHIKPVQRPAGLPAVVLPVKPPPGGGLALWAIIAIAVGALALALAGGLLARRFYGRRRLGPAPPAVAAAAPGPPAPVPPPPLPAPAPEPAPAEMVRRRPRPSPRQVLAGAALAALALAAARTSRIGLDRRRR
jgi:hypothetical protein